MSSVNAAASEADAVGRQIQQALSVTATPQVNNAHLAETPKLVNAIQTGLPGIGGMVQLVPLLGLTQHEPQLCRSRSDTIESA